jgi:hypothetical protein
MMPRFTLFLVFIATSVFSASALAQPQAAPPKPETARQALIEIVTKGGNAWQKHLTVEVQDILKSSGKANSWGVYSMLNSMKGESGLQSFESGEVLFAYTVSAQHTKYEVHVDNDDLAGDEDSMQLSIHAFHDGKELDGEWGIMSSHFTVSMKLQQNIWRVDMISVGAEFPIGDPKFFAKTFLKMADGEASSTAALLPEPHTTFALSSGLSEASPPGMPPDQVVRMLAFAESSFAPQHPEAGFTCSFSDLAEWAKLMQVDQQVITGSYNGYRFALSGCEGKPAGSFQITAEPLLATPGVKAFCTDATHNLRASDDGRGTTCLASGKVQINQADGEGDFVGLIAGPSEANPKK